LMSLNEMEIKRPLIIMLTNHSTVWYRQKCLEYGADFFLDKTAEIEQLPGIIAEQYIQETLRNLNKNNVN
ncbi:MAG: response regulator, partial [Candidatus Omnitrophica bacterium]|nr:response regulator [Candidatus Omnitrophota bacterium]